MKKIITLLLFALILNHFSCKSKNESISFSDKDKQEIIDRETKSWEYFKKNKNSEKLKEILADDNVGYFGLKTMNKDEGLQSLD